MTKSLLALFAALLTICVSAQTRTFSFTDVQSRNSLQQWEKLPGTTLRTAQFTPGKIDLKIDRNYHLKIVQTTHLPDKGAIYLCKDEQQHDITVMLVSDDRMFFVQRQKTIPDQFQTSCKTLGRQVVCRCGLIEISSRKWFFQCLYL
jgi:hypothetical protein